MEKTTKARCNPCSIMNPICRGIVGYISYLASCGASPVYSEYLLYEPILRIAQSKGLGVSHEHPLKREIAIAGDKERLDYKFASNDFVIALEVKWVRTKNAVIKKDVEKLKRYINYRKDKKTVGYVLIFGAISDVEGFIEKNKWKTSAHLVKWESGKTNYAAAWREYK